MKPDWWPKCPYPEDIFPMPRKRYAEIVPDPDIRTSLSGMLGREFWTIAETMIWERFCQAVEDGNLITVDIKSEGQKLTRDILLEALRIAYRELYSEYVYCPWCSGHIGWHDEQHDEYCICVKLDLMIEKKEASPNASHSK